MATSNTAIKITQLPNIGNNIAASTLIPVVNMAGVPITQKANLQITGNLILAGAGGANFVPAAVANLAYSVANSYQPNITRVGNLNINTFKVTGGVNGQYLQTDGTGNLSFVSGGGSGNGVVGGANTQIQYNNAGNFGGSTGLTWNGSTGVLSTLNLSVSSGATIYGNTALTNLNVAGNLTTNNIFTDNYFYANGDPFGGGGNANTGNVTFNDINIIGTGNLNLQPDPADAGAYLDIFISSGPDIHLVASQSANLILGKDEQSNVMTSWDGNVYIQSWDNNTNTQGGVWTFGGDGNLTAPGNIIIDNGVDGNISSNGNVNVISNGNTWTFGTGGTTRFPNDTIKLGNSIPIGILTQSGNVYTQINQFPNNWEVYSEDDTTAANPGVAWIRADLPTVDTPQVFIETQKGSDGVSHRWTFDEDGNLTLPANAFSVNYANGTQVPLSAPVGSSGAAQFNWQGNFSNQGGTPGDTYSTLQFDSNGIPTLDGTNAYQQRVDNSPYMQILAPRVESTDFGIVAGPGLTVVGYDDNYNIPRSAYLSVQDQANATQQWDFGILGNGDNNFVVSDRTNSNQWTFGTNGNLTLPTNTFSVNYANGTQVPLGGGNTSQISNGNSNVSIPTSNDNVYINTNNGTSKQWIFNKDGSLRTSGNVDIYGAINFPQQVSNINWSTYNIELSQYGRINTNVDFFANANVIGAQYLKGDGSNISNISVPNTDWANIGNINNTNGPTKLAIGQNAGSNTQGNSAVAIGIDAGENNQGFISIAIGAGAGGNGQGQAAVAIGTDTGANIQGIEAIAIGFKAGNQGQGQQSIAIGAKAGNVNQGNNSIILNATGNPLDQTTANTFTVSPVRNDTSNIAEVMFYNTTSKEVTYGNTISVAGNVTANNFIGNGSQLTGIPTQTTGNWTLTPGVNTANINVPTSGTYSIWINGNIPNGIVTYIATAVITNTNVPVLGEQYGWYYLAGNALVLTSIPNQFVGTQGAISNAAPYSGNTANVFTFGITNNSGANAVVNWGYTKL